MVQRFFIYFISRTHFWRRIGYSELAELYVSRMLRMTGLQMIAGFSVVYMYQLGYSLSFIAWYWLFYFLLRALVAPLAAVVVARYGPKHGTLLSNLAQVAAALLLIFLPHFGLWVLILYAPVAGFSRTLYDISYMVDFSKVKHIEHSGKEIGIMQIIERVMTSLGPLMGGVVALFLGAQAMFGFSSLLLIISAVPLLVSAEPVKIRQKITLRHFNWKLAWRPSVGEIGVGIDNNLSGFIWNLFLALVVLGATSNAVYAQIGALSSISMLASIACAYFYGRLVDRHRGKPLLKRSVVGDAVVHALRAFVTVPVQVLGLNVANEVVTAGFTLPVTRAIFDTADGLPGYRIVYMTVMEVMLCVGNVLVMLVLVGLTYVVSDTQALRLLYIVLAPTVLVIALHSSVLYKKGVLTRFIHRV